MNDEMAYIKGIISDIAKDYSLNPKVAQELLRRIIAILQSYQDNQNEEEQP
ncbi:hypothetical protein LJC61_02235 [Ruminococcaceae bacterium OttesenSCG-928-A16]|nr:hypothetical protein [Ruminococcaceae bacterium OttesenSCG-928-A16]